MNTTKATWVMEWERGKQHEVQAANDLKAILGDLSDPAGSRPLIAVLLSPTGKSLLLGLGRAESVVQYQPAPDASYSGSVGSEETTGVITFDYFGEETEFEQRHAVPTSVAKAAAIEFFERDDRPTNLRWTEV